MEAATSECKKGHRTIDPVTAVAQWWEFKIKKGGLPPIKRFEHIKLNRLCGPCLSPTANKDAVERHF